VDWWWLLLIGLALIGGAVVVLIWTRERHRNASVTEKPSWDMASAITSTMTAVGGAFLTLSAVVAVQPDPAAAEVRVPVPGPTVTVVATPPPPEPVKVTWSVPANGDLVKNCVALSGRVEDLASDEAVVVGNRSGAEDRWYFEDTVHLNGDRTQWSLAMTLGSPDDRAKGPYSLIVLVMPKERVAYLVSTNPDASFWSSPDLPPDVRGSEGITVTREFLTERC
jgi:hypothetical protein